MWACKHDGNAFYLGCKHHGGNVGRAYFAVSLKLQSSVTLPASSDWIRSGTLYQVKSHNLNARRDGVDWIVCYYCMWDVMFVMPVCWVMSLVIRSIHTLVNYMSASDDCFHIMNTCIIKLLAIKDTFYQPVIHTLIFSQSQFDKTEVCHPWLMHNTYLMTGSSLTIAGWKKKKQT